MLSDLNKYITENLEVYQYGTANLMIHLLERVQSNRLAESIIISFRNNIDMLAYEGADILNDIIWDAHFQDIITHCEIEEQILINMMMSCFNMEYLSETWINDIQDYYLRYTYRGTKITKSQENILCNYIEQEWPDFIHEFRNEECFEQWEKGNIDLDFGEDYEFRAMNIVLDINNPFYPTVAQFLKDLDFNQVDDELFMYASYETIGYASYAPSFEWIKIELIDALKDIPKKRELHKRDIECLSYLDFTMINNTLFSALTTIKPYSSREVIL